MATQTANTRRELILACADALQEHTAVIVEANRQDCKAAEASKLSPALLKRLHCDADKVQSMCTMLRSIANLDDIVGTVMLKRELDQGLILKQLRCPIGVIGFIFESRPDAFVQMIGLCTKTANALIAKGGSEAQHTNSAIYAIAQDVYKAAGLASSWIHLLENRADVQWLLKSQQVDMIIPRGSNEFVSYIMQTSSIPVLGHADGICHVYIDAQADREMARAITLDAKTEYVAVCNAMETLLIHEEQATNILKELCTALEAESVQLRGCPRCRDIVPDMQAADDADWDSEYLDYCLSIRIVDSVEEAVAHINKHGSKHSDSIITNNDEAAAYFLSMVDSASVMRNCSTRFSDGFRYGLGAESGISTGKLHARGPVGQEGLCTYKWQLEGSGHVVADYSNGRSFTHRDLTDT